MGQELLPTVLKTLWRHCGCAGCRNPSELPQKWEDTGKKTPTKILRAEGWGANIHRFEFTGRGAVQQPGFNAPQKLPLNSIKIIKHHSSAFVSAGFGETDILTCCCQLLQGVWAAKEQALNKLFSYRMQIRNERSQHGADKGFVVFWRAGEYQGLHKHTCTDQLRKISSTYGQLLGRLQHTAQTSPFHWEAKRQRHLKAHLLITLN